MQRQAPLSAPGGGAARTVGPMKGQALLCLRRAQSSLHVALQALRGLSGRERRKRPDRSRLLELHAAAEQRAEPRPPHAPACPLGKGFRKVGGACGGSLRTKKMRDLFHRTLLNATTLPTRARRAQCLNFPLHPAGGGGSALFFSLSSWIAVIMRMTREITISTDRTMTAMTSGSMTGGGLGGWAGGGVGFPGGRKG